MNADKNSGQIRIPDRILGTDGLMNDISKNADKNSGQIRILGTDSLPGCICF